eukprot:gene2217-2525_t
MDSQIAKDWIKYTFAPSIEKSRESVLFLDNLNYQATKEFQELCREEANCIVYPFSPDETDKIQPVDAGDGFIWGAEQGQQFLGQPDELLPQDITQGHHLGHEQKVKVRSIFIEWKVMNGLQCYGLMDLIKNYPDVFESAFCPTEDFKSTRPVFSELEFNEEGSNKKKIEVDVYKFFMDFVERCFEGEDSPKVEVKVTRCNILRTTISEFQKPALVHSHVKFSSKNNTGAAEDGCGIGITRGDEQEVVDKCFEEKFYPEEDLLDFLSAYKCNRQPNKDTIEVMVRELAHQELIQKPRYVANVSISELK